MYKERIEWIAGVLQDLTAVFGCSGREEAVNSAIRRYLPPWIEPEAIRTDALGNLIVRTGCKTGPRIMLDAHMDSVGLMITGLEEGNLCCFRTIGFLLPQMLLDQPVLFENGIAGRVIQAEGMPLERGLDSLRIRMEPGANSPEIGDVCVFKPAFQREGDRVRGTYLDNRAGCAALLAAMQKMQDVSNDVYCVFSVQEEAGMRGASVAAREIQPEAAFVVDMGISGEEHPNAGNRHITLGGGVIQKIMDDSIICHRDSLLHMKEAAKTHNIPLMPLVGGAGYTNGGGIHLAGKGIPTALLGIPTKGIHSAAEEIHLRDVMACADLLTALAAMSAKKKGESK